MARPRFLILGIWRLSEEVEIDVFIITSLRAYSPHWLGAHDILQLNIVNFKPKPLKYLSISTLLS